MTDTRHLTDQIERIDFDEAVKEVRHLCAQIELGNLMLGKIVARIKPDDPEQTIKRLARSLDLPEKELRRYRDLWLVLSKHNEGAK